MSKVLVKFTTGHGRYNKGEVACFEADKAKALEKAKVAKIEGEPKEDSKAKNPADDLEKRAADLDQREADLRKSAADLDRRLADLNEMAADLDQREADLNELSKKAEQVSETSAGAPPKTAKK